MAYLITIGLTVDLKPETDSSNHNFKAEYFSSGHWGLGAEQWCDK